MSSDSSSHCGGNCVPGPDAPYRCSPLLGSGLGVAPGVRPAPEGPSAGAPGPAPAPAWGPWFPEPAHSELVCRRPQDSVPGDLRASRSAPPTRTPILSVNLVSETITNSTRETSPRSDFLGHRTLPHAPLKTPGPKPSCHLRDHTLRRVPSHRLTPTATVGILRPKLHGWS